MTIRGIITTTVMVLAIIAVSTTTAAALSCSDGDICVNQSGWWRDGGAFNASGAPIQAAVNSATAGETIFVWNGSYTENVDITKQLTLRGESADLVTVTAADDGDHVFDVTADYVNISGFTATGAIVSGNAGIYLRNSQHCNISNNNASGNHYGIILIGSSNNTLTGNDCSNNDKFGIYLSSSSNNTLASNTANLNEQYGIYLYRSSNNTLLGNTANSNDHHGIYLCESSNSTLASNTANSNSDFYGIYLWSSSNNTLLGNTASNNSDGIYLTFSSNNTLDGNNASNNYCGIYLWSSSNNNTLLNNTANSNNDYGICLDNADNNNITCNWVHNNTDAGFYLKSESTGNTIERNNIIANGNYNDMSGGWEWQFWNDQSADVGTAGNWWGTSNETRINASINDRTYDASRGNVTTSPKLDGTVPCAPIPELPTALFLAVGLLMLVGCARIGRKT